MDAIANVNANTSASANTSICLSAPVYQLPIQTVGNRKLKIENCTSGSC